MKHDSFICLNVPYTAYFSMATWSWQIRCPTCASPRRQYLNRDGRGAVMCDGVSMAQAARVLELQAE